LNFLLPTEIEDIGIVLQYEPSSEIETTGNFNPPLKIRAPGLKNQQVSVNLTSQIENQSGIGSGQHCLVNDFGCVLFLNSGLSLLEQGIRDLPLLVIRNAQISQRELGLVVNLAVQGEAYEVPGIARQPLDGLRKLPIGLAKIGQTDGREDDT
jgi:hypothetical protein